MDIKAVTLTCPKCACAFVVDIPAQSPESARVKNRTIRCQSCGLRGRLGFFYAPIEHKGKCKGTLAEYAAEVRSRVPEHAIDYEWLIQFEYEQGRPVERCAMAVRVFLALLSNNPHAMLQLVDTPEVQNNRPGDWSSHDSFEAGAPTIHDTAGVYGVDDTEEV